MKKLHIKLKNLKLFLLFVGIIFTFSFGWPLILQQNICTEEAVAEAKKMGAHYSVGRVNLSGQSNVSTRIASFIEKDKALVMLGKTERIESITCEFDEELIITPVSEVQLVKDYSVCQLVLCILKNPLEKIKPFTTPSVSDVIKRLESSSESSSSELIYPEAYCLGYGPNIKPQTLDYDNNYQLKIGTIRLTIEKNSFRRPCQSKCPNIRSLPELGELFEFSFFDSREQQDGSIRDTSYACLIGGEDLGSPLFCYREDQSPDLIGIAFTSKINRSPSSGLVLESEQWFICLPGILKELKIARNMGVTQEGHAQELSYKTPPSAPCVKRKREVPEQAHQTPKKRDKGKEKVTVHSENITPIPITCTELSDDKTSSLDKDFGALSIRTPNLPHGLTIYTFQNGIITKNAYNGWSSYQAPGGPEVWIYSRPFCIISPPKQEWYEYPNGTREKFGLDGTMVQHFSSGEEHIRNSDGTETFHYPHGVTRIYYMNGSKKELFPNGWTCIAELNKPEKWTYEPCYDLELKEMRGYQYSDFKERVFPNGHIEWILNEGRIIVRHLVGDSITDVNTEKNDHGEPLNNSQHRPQKSKESATKKSRIK